VRFVIFDDLPDAHTVRMEALTSEIALYLLAAAVFGIVVGVLIRGARIRSVLEQVQDEWQAKLDDVIHQKDQFASETAVLRSNIEDQNIIVRQHETTITKNRTDLESAYAKQKLMSKDLFNLRAEREGFKKKVFAFQNALLVAKQQSAALHEEFIKSGEVYKRELAKAFEKRKALEVKMDNAKLEQESFINLLQASKSEQESINRMLDSARNRLAHLDELEQTVIRLEAENAQLNHDASLAQQKIQSLQRDAAEIDELKVQNKELAHCLKSMESSRRQYEEDAKRYREQAGQYEKHSETLRLQLDEVEKHFADMEIQQRQALKEARAATANPSSNGKTPPEPETETELETEPDNLQEIVGIGKVFEQTLHGLGIVSFEQIANLDGIEFAQLNEELKEFKGRVEQDDWVGQAKDLYLKKYGAAN
jgi:predicted flap endonuclease-1-like 5' DNA nuclease